MAGFDAAHIQNIIDQRQQVGCAFADPIQIIAGIRIQAVLFQGKRIQTDDHVHGRTDFVAHVGQEGTLGLIGLLRGAQGFALRHGIPHFGIDVHHADDDILPVTFHAGNLHAGIDRIAADQLAVCHKMAIIFPKDARI